MNEERMNARFTSHMCFDLLIAVQLWVKIHLPLERITNAVVCVETTEWFTSSFAPLSKSNHNN
jgi:hypothetical protein